MSSEIYLGALTWPDIATLRLDDSDDQVVRTANNRPDSDSLPALADPTLDHIDPALAARREAVDEKQARVARFLDATGYDAVVLGRADSVAWFTCGAETGQALGGDTSAVLLYITRGSRAVVCDNVQSARVFEEEVAGLGFQLKERPWYDDPTRLVAELGRSRRLATDLHLALGTHELPRLRALRWSLTKLERQRLRELGRTLALALEATCRNFQPGETEADVAGHLAHRLLREGVVPIDLRVASEDRLDRYRQPTFKAAQIHRRATIAAVGRRHGLCASATRSVSFGPLDPEFRDAHALAAMVDATCIFFSRPGETVAGAFKRARRIYEKFGHPDEWTLDYQGSLIGYSPREAVLLPDSALALESDQAICWSPSVGPARSEDTVVVDDRGFEVVTEAQNWPKLEIFVKDFGIHRPGVLER